MSIADKAATVVAAAITGVAAALVTNHVMQAKAQDDETEMLENARANGYNDGWNNALKSESQVRTAALKLGLIPPDEEQEGVTPMRPRRTTRNPAA